MPIDDFMKKASAAGIKAAQAKHAELRGRRGEELELWKKWKATKSEAHLEALLLSLDPVIEGETNQRLISLGGTMPKAALKNELRVAVLKGLESFDPNMGAGLFTHVKNQMQRVTDVVNKARNSKYVPRKTMELYQAHENVKLDLTETLGRPPTLEEIQVQMPKVKNKAGRMVPVKIDDLKRLRLAGGKEMFTGMGDDVGANAPRMGVREAYAVLYPTFKPHEHVFMDLHYPEDGASKDIKSISKIMKMPEHRVYRIKQQVETRLDRLLKKE